MSYPGSSIVSTETSYIGLPENLNANDAAGNQSPEAEAARAKTAAVMAALKKGDQGEADRLMGKNENHDSLIPGFGKLKGMILGRKKKEEPLR